MTKTYRWGIIGPGKIANEFAKALSNVGGSRLYAVASRDLKRAKSFAANYGAEKYYGGYEALASDPDVDAVYIATPHTYHHAHTLLCLQNKKPVLCEKPLSVNYQSTLEMITAARQHKTFLMEAMWTRFLPAVDKAIQLIREGK